jgi:hypothetical protein
MTFELWDIESGNIVGAYAAEADALAVVQWAIGAQGQSYANALVLFLDDGGDIIKTLAGRAELVARAQGVRVTPVLGAS